MKKTFILSVIFAVAAVCSVSAQSFSKGDMLLKGSIGLNTSGIGNKDGKASQNLISIAPEFEYFLNDRLSVGGTLGYSNQWTGEKIPNFSGDQTYKTRVGTHVFTIGANINYYLPLSDRFFVSFEGFLGYQGRADRDVEILGGNKTKVTANQMDVALLTVTPAINCMINDHWIVNASIGGFYALAGSAGEKIAAYGVGVDFGTFTFGIGYKF